MNCTLTLKCSPFRPYVASNSVFKMYYPSPNTPASNQILQDEITPKLSKEKVIIAHILFPTLRRRLSNSQFSMSCDPSLDQELEVLKNTMLSQSFADLQKQSTADGSPSIGSINQQLFAYSQNTETTNGALCHQEKNIGDGQKKVGAYTLIERQKRIIKYKAKLKKWRALHPLSRKFDGRRQVAFKKCRLNGKFAKATSNQQQSEVVDQ